MKQTLRTSTTQNSYNLFIKYNPDRDCYLCKAKVIKSFKYWKIIENEFPYDKISDTHHMITIKKHKKEDDLTAKEKEEFKKVKKYIHKNYDMIFENTVRTKSIPNHHHLHMIELKEIKITNKNNNKHTNNFSSSSEFYKHKTLTRERNLSKCSF